MSSAPTADAIASDATWLAQALEPGAGLVRLVAMNRDSYRAASFLDDRLLQQPVDAQVAPWSLIEEAMTGQTRSDARWIFHIGHVGSTLGSRLLGELDKVLSIREPRLLRDLALTSPQVRERYISLIGPLMSRTFASDEIACIKTTSFASEIAPELVPPAGRALFMYTSLQPYVATILAGENSLKELEQLIPYRAKRMAGRVPELTQAGDSPAHAAAAAWACEMTALEAASISMRGRSLLWADFEAVLDDLPGTLVEIARFFGFDAPEAQVAAVAGGPLLGRYSKAPEYEYSRELRNELLRASQERFKDEITDALAMLERAAEKAPLLARSLGRSGIGS